jgi:hypothetical protein
LICYQWLHPYQWLPPLLSEKFILSGKDGSDAKPYQEKDVDSALKQSTPQLFGQSLQAV